MDADDEQAVRQRLAALEDAELEAVLAPRELEALRHGYRERVTDTHLPGIAALPETLPPLFSQAAARARQAGLRRCRIALRPRVYHGFFLIGDEST